MEDYTDEIDAPQLHQFLKYYMNKISLVSVLTPTYNRRKFIPQYLRNIKNQDYNGPIEILIADDGTDSIEDLLPNESSFKYIKLDSKKTIGYKRNLLCDEAKGDILINMDDDDSPQALI